MQDYFGQPDFVEIHHPSRKDFGRCVNSLPPGEYYTKVPEISGILPPRSRN